MVKLDKVANLARLDKVARVAMLDKVVRVVSRDGLGIFSNSVHCL